jgi:hypothetical protein
MDWKGTVFRSMKWKGIRIAIPDWNFPTMDSVFAGYY